MGEGTIIRVDRARETQEGRELGWSDEDSRYSELQGVNDELLNHSEVFGCEGWAELTTGTVGIMKPDDWRHTVIRKV